MESDKNAPVKMCRASSSMCQVVGLGGIRYFSDNDEQLLICYYPALSACPANCSGNGPLCRRQLSGLRAMSIVRSFGLAVTVVAALIASPLLTAAPAFAQVKWNLPSA